MINKLYAISILEIEVSANYIVNIVGLKPHFTQLMRNKQMQMNTSEKNWTESDLEMESWRGFSA